MNKGLKTVLIFWAILAGIFVFFMLPILINPEIGGVISLINIIIFIIISVSILLYKAEEGS